MSIFARHGSIDFRPKWSAPRTTRRGRPACLPYLPTPTIMAEGPSESTNLLEGAGQQVGHAQAGSHAPHIVPVKAVLLHFEHALHIAPLTA